MAEKRNFYREAIMSYGDLKRRGHRCSEVFGAVGNKVSHIYSILHARVVIMVSAISQLRVLASHRRKFGVCRSRRLEIRALGNGEVPFFE